MSPRKVSNGTVLVTGASGFLGQHLLNELMARGRHVRALVRTPSLALEKAGVEVVLGDVCRAEDCGRALDGVTEVIHAAGFVSRDPEAASAMYRIHVEGTRALLSQAAAAGAERVVVVSSSGTVAVSKRPDEVSTEASPYRLSTVSNWPYYLSKIYQEQTALRLGEELGLDVVIVSPSLLLGPGDDRGSSTGDVEKVVRGRLPIIPRGGGVAFVDVRDAARGCIAAMEKGRPGERYLFNGANMTLETFLGRVARLAEVPSPRAVIAPDTMRAVGGWVEALCRKVDIKPPIEKQSIEMAEHTWYVDHSKAFAELGFEPRDAQETLLDTVRDIQRRRGSRIRGGSYGARAAG